MVSIAPRVRPRESRPFQLARDAWTWFRVDAPRERLRNLGQARNGALNPLNIAVLQWNIFKGRRPTLSARLQELAAGQDLVLLQEAVLPGESLIDGDLRLHGSGDEHHWWFASTFILGDGAVTGVATGSVVGALSASSVISEHLEPVVGSPKTALLTCYALAGRSDSLMVANLHALNFVPTNRFKTNIQTIESAIRLHEGPLLVAGDFNSWTLGRRKAVLSMAGRMGMTSVKPEATRSISGFLFYTQAFVRGLDVLSATFLDKGKASDHPPLVYRLRAL